MSDASNWELPAADAWQSDPTPNQAGGPITMPPYDMRAEQAVLGSMLLSGDALATVTGILRGSDFFVGKHEVLFDTILSLYSLGEAVDPVSVPAMLHKKGDLQRAGGEDYIQSLTSVPPRTAAVESYAQIVVEKALLRRLVTAGSRITEMGYRGQGDAKDLVSQAEQEVFNVMGDDKSADYVPLNEAVTDAVNEIAKAQSMPDGLRGVSTGFRELDEKTNGFRGGQMIIIAARPAMGKSTLALDVARAAAIKSNTTTVFFSLEMTRTEIATRLIAAESSIPMGVLTRGDLDDDNWSRLAQTQAKINEAPLFIDDSPNMTLVEVRAKCRRLKERNNLGMVVIDYLQLLSSGQRVESRQQEVSEFSRSLKLLAKELDVPVVALSQLNRASEQRADKMPAMSDLRESGSLEQDADMVILLHRDTSSEPDNPRAGEADLILAKQRNGPTGTITVAFQGMYSRFRDMA